MWSLAYINLSSVFLYVGIGTLYNVGKLHVQCAFKYNECSVLCG